MLLDTLFQQALTNGASDIHILTGSVPHMRVDGVLSPIPTANPLTAKDTEAIVKALLDENRLKKFLIEKDLDISYEIPTGARFRVNLHFEKGVIGLSARVIPLKVPSMGEIGIPESLYPLCNLDRGLILVTGPTGCGKSTTLAAMVDYINQSRSANIITLEDPVEFVFTPVKSLIRQRQLGTDMMTFQNGLVHVLRQDPNVVMVGEMRNLETIATTITLAETGHLVFATLHTYSAEQTIDRIIDSFPPHQQNQVRTQISMTLKAVIAQRLLPRADKGRVAAREILINTPAVANLIRESNLAQIRTVMQTGAKDGMMTLDTAIAQLYQQGAISKETHDAHVVDNTRQI